MNSVKTFTRIYFTTPTIKQCRNSPPIRLRTQVHTNDFLGRWIKSFGILLLGAGCLLALAPMVKGNHQGNTGHSIDHRTGNLGPGHPIPGASFKVFLDKGEGPPKGVAISEDQGVQATQTVVKALTSMTRHRAQYHRFDEALTKNALQEVIIEPKVLNREGKEFPFLVARTKQKGKVKLLVSASALEENGYVNNPDKLIPVLAREFQWVIIKADTAPKRKTVNVQRDLKNAPIKTNKEIGHMSGEERLQILQELFQTYLTTVDDYKSLENQPAYGVGSFTLMDPTQPDSTTKQYDIRVREALQLIVKDPYFEDQAPKAVRSLLNGKIWNVSFAKIDERDWATRTRVLPKNKAVTVGKNGRTIQPAKILVNVYRTAAPDDPFYTLANGLPMGALSADQLARVIALEIQKNITDKSMRGHVAQDEITVPK